MLLGKVFQTLVLWEVRMGLYDKATTKIIYDVCVDWSRSDSAAELNWVELIYVSWKFCLNYSGILRAWDTKRNRCNRPIPIPGKTLRGRLVSKPTNKQQAARAGHKPKPHRNRKYRGKTATIWSRNWTLGGSLMSMKASKMGAGMGHTAANLYSLPVYRATSSLPHPAPGIPCLL